MKKFLFLIPVLLLLTGCPDKEEIKNATEDLKEKRADAIKVIEATNYNLEGLLKTQDYFFSFAERVHLMRAEEEAKKLIKSMVKDLGVKGFCEAFIMPTPIWKGLEEYCSSGTFYKCSPEIKEYKIILEKFKEIAGDELNQRFKSEASCN